METNNKKVPTIRTVLVPVFSVLIIFNLILVVLILKFNESTRILSTTMEKTTELTEDVTSLLAGSSLLSETSISFVSKPSLADGSTNTGPLIAYITELNEKHRGEDIIKIFKDVNADSQSLNYLEAATSNANMMLDYQNHAIGLVLSIYPLPPIPIFDNIDFYEPTTEELALSNEERLNLAKDLVFAKEYGSAKFYVSQNVNDCVDHLHDLSNEKIHTINKELDIIKIVLIIHTLLITSILVVTFIVIYQFIIRPLNKHTQGIESEEYLTNDSSFKEVCLLASTYNKLLERRNELESKLRNMAETDTLTNLANRYAFEKYIDNISKESNDKSIAYILFDVNYLKKTNDNYGHQEGDKLLVRASHAINECFKKGDEMNCFRIGGDEFVSIISDITTEELGIKLEKFAIVQKENNVSISFGCAYSNSLKDTSIKALMREADVHMYEKKKDMHKNDVDRIV